MSPLRIPLDTPFAAYLTGLYALLAVIAVLVIVKRN